MMRRVLHAWADGAAAFAAVLREHDPSWRSETFELAGGRAVLWGRGLYVNRALAAGVDRSMTATDFETLECRSDALGVPSALEVTPMTSASVVELAAERGYVATGVVTALRHHLAGATGDGVGGVDGVLVEPADVPTWQAIAAAGWGHEQPAARRASDAFAAAAAVVDGDGFVVARDADDGRPIGCATLSMRDGIATLAGMSTLPSERRRGVQAALVHHRLLRARAAGCAVATSTTVSGGASERNLRRLGFEAWFEVTTLTRSTGSVGRRLAPR